MHLTKLCCIAANDRLPLCHVDAVGVELGSSTPILKPLIYTRVQGLQGVLGAMVYYCKDCEHEVGSITSMHLHRRLGHTIAWIDGS